MNWMNCVFDVGRRSAFDGASVPGVRAPIQRGVKRRRSVDSDDVYEEPSPKRRRLSSTRTDESSMPCTSDARSTRRLNTAGVEFSSSLRGVPIERTAVFASYISSLLYRQASQVTGALWSLSCGVIFVNENENEMAKNEKITNSLTKTKTKTKKYCKTKMKLKLKTHWKTKTKTKK